MNTTESINLVAFTLGRTFPHEDDMVILTEMETCSILSTWQYWQRKGIHWCSITPDGLLQLDEYGKFGAKPRLVAFTHMSNVGDNKSS
jgi:cysteine desulfurase/selenocysteine lyase